MPNNSTNLHLVYRIQGVYDINELLKIRQKKRVVPEQLLAPIAPGLTITKSSLHDWIIYGRNIS